MSRSAPSNLARAMAVLAVCGMLVLVARASPSWATPHQDPHRQSIPTLTSTFPPVAPMPPPPPTDTPILIPPPGGSQPTPRPTFTPPPAGPRPSDTPVSTPPPAAPGPLDTPTFTPPPAAPDTSIPPPTGPSPAALPDLTPGTLGPAPTTLYTWLGTSVPTPAWPTLPASEPLSATCPSCSPWPAVLLAIVSAALVAGALILRIRQTRFHS